MALMVYAAMSSSLLLIVLEQSNILFFFVANQYPFFSRTQFKDCSRFVLFFLLVKEQIEVDQIERLHKFHTIYMIFKCSLYLYLYK